MGSDLVANAPNTRHGAQAHTPPGNCSLGIHRAVSWCPGGGEGIPGRQKEAALSRLQFHLIWMPMIPCGVRAEPVLEGDVSKVVLEQPGLGLPLWFSS